MIHDTTSSQPNIRSVTGRWGDRRTLRLPDEVSKPEKNIRQPLGVHSSSSVAQNIYMATIWSPYNHIINIEPIEFRWYMRYTPRNVLVFHYVPNPNRRYDGAGRLDAFTEIQRTKKTRLPGICSHFLRCGLWIETVDAQISRYDLTVSI